MSKNKSEYLINRHDNQYEVVIGLEVHAQVTSQSKLFSTSATKFGAEPNTQVSLVDAAFPGMLPVMASMKVNSKTVSRWGIYSLNKKISKNDYFIDGVVEKPSVKNAPSNKAVIGRYVLPKTIFSKLAKQKPGNGGEIHITDAIQILITEGEKFIAHNFSGNYLDCGTMQGFINSNKEIGKL